MTSADNFEIFFQGLATAPHPVLHDVEATIRVDLDEGGVSKHWHLTIDHGQVQVTRRNAPADAILRTDPALFERIMTGEANALTAALRGRLRIDGNPRLLVSFKRLLPGPPARATQVPPPAPGTATAPDGEHRTDLTDERELDR